MNAYVFCRSSIVDVSVYTSRSPSQVVYCNLIDSSQCVKKLRSMWQHCGRKTTNILSIMHIILHFTRYIHVVCSRAKREDKVPFLVLNLFYPIWIILVIFHVVLTKKLFWLAKVGSIPTFRYFTTEQKCLKCSFYKWENNAILMQKASSDEWVTACNINCTFELLYSYNEIGLYWIN